MRTPQGIGQCPPKGHIGRVRMERWTLRVGAQTLGLKGRGRTHKVTGESPLLLDVRDVGCYGYVIGKLLKVAREKEGRIPVTPAVHQAGEAGSRPMGCPVSSPALLPVPAPYGCRDTKQALGVRVREGSGGTGQIMSNLLAAMEWTGHQDGPRGKQGHSGHCQGTLGAPQRATCYNLVPSVVSREVLWALRSWGLGGGTKVP